MIEKPPPASPFEGSQGDFNVSFIVGSGINQHFLLTVIQQEIFMMFSDIF